MNIREARGAIFDVDDTLLDNKPGLLGKGLHERSRLAAFREVGKRHNIPELTNITLQENLDAFLTAPVHSMQSAAWNYLYTKGLVATIEIEPENELLREIVAYKEALHGDIIRNEAEEVPGASAFVRTLGRNGLDNYMAIASSAIRRDVDLFLAKVSLEEYFPEEHIKTIELVTHTKPHPEIYNLAFASLDLPETARSSVLAFEDDPRGIMSAKAAGLYTCAITTRYPKAELQALEVAPDLVADSFAEFSELLQLAVAGESLPGGH
jgi:HAD superfamily hydrolase (TIGR01509 family)